MEYLLEIGHKLLIVVEKQAPKQHCPNKLVEAFSEKIAKTKKRA